MTPAAFVNQLQQSASDRATLTSRLLTYSPTEQIAVNAALREAFITAMRVSGADTDRCVASAYWLATQIDHPRQRAFALRLHAQALAIVHGKFDQSLPLFEEAAALYGQIGEVVEQANVQVSAIWAIARAVGYDAAIALSDSTKAVLQDHKQWRSLATLNNNLAVIHNRFGRFDLALAALEKAQSAYVALGPIGEPYLTNIDSNRAYVHYTLGQYRAAIAAAEAALDRAVTFKQHALVARCQHNLALTYSALGNYRRSLELFDRARTGWLADGRLQEVVQSDLTATYALLKLRRFHDVLARCARVRELIAEHNIKIETPFSLLNEPFAYSELGEHQSAENALHAIRQLILQTGSPWDNVRLQLAESRLLLQRGEAIAAENQTLALLPQISEQEGIALAWLLAAKAAVAQEAWQRAAQHAQRGLQAAPAAPTIVFDAERILGRVAQARGDLATAHTHLQRALTALEQINVMSEHRAQFLEDEDKRSLYSDLITLALAQDDPALGLHYAEQARSRTLQELIGHRVDLSIRALDVRDQSLVMRFNQLNEQRQQMMRHHEQESDAAERARIFKQQQQVEREVTQAWHQLLIRNQAYTAATPFAATAIDVPVDSVLLEYFAVGDGMVLFVVSAENPTPTVYHLPLSVAQLNKQYAALQLNMQLIARTPPAFVLRLLPNANGILRKLYQSLIAPCSADIAAGKRLIIVPHGTLHYLPFHALLAADDRYLIESNAVSYLPAARFMTHGNRPSGMGMLSLGYSSHGKLPATITEAQTVAQRWSHRLLLEEEATLANIEHWASEYAILHLATHAEFRGDNPLFSGLQLDDGWLTTLDIFNLRLNAELVTLSACSTGRSVIGGGDELLGLTRAFMAAGAAALLMTHWPVVDDVTQTLIGRFYDQLAAGQTKDRALQHAQCDLLQTARADQHAYQHPYFWSPFFLLGSTNRLG